MSGIETVRIIVEAEKEAAKILEDAQTKASEIRRRLESLIEETRNEILESARKEAAMRVQRAEDEGRTEAERHRKDSEQGIQELVSRASAKKEAAVDKLVPMIMEEKV